MAADTNVESRLWLLQERLKQERLFVNKEKTAINVLNSEVQATCEKLFHVSWITSQQWRNLGRLQAYPSKSSYATSLLDCARFMDAYNSLGYLESKYGEFLKGLRENPTLVASTLAFADSVNMDMKQVLRLILNSLYGNCLLPEDENHVLVLMKSLIELQILKSDKPQEFFRSPRNWSFTIIFSVLIESLFSAKLYLTAALHTQILQVLGNDSRIQAKLPYICTLFVQSLEEKLYCFPSSLRWLVCQLYNTLKTKGKMSDREAKSMVSELLFNYLVCPAIINPEPYGINSDMQVSKVARLNLQQISSLLCKKCASPWQGQLNQRYSSEDLFGSLDTHCISSFIDAILRGASNMPDFPAERTIPCLARSSVLITENELRALIAFMKMISNWENPGDFIDIPTLQDIISNLPPESKPVSKTTPAPPKADSPRGSPHPPRKQKRGFAKLRGRHTQQENVSADEDEAEKKVAVSLLAPFAPAVPQYQLYQQECLKRLGELFTEGEGVLVVPLGYSSVQPPGMLPEDKVLGIEKPPKQETIKKVERQNSNSDQPFRMRTGSNKFTELFSKMSLDKELDKVDSESSSNEIETSGEHMLGEPEPPSHVQAQPPLLPIQPSPVLQYQPLQPQAVHALQPQQLDLVQSTTSGATPFPGGIGPPLVGPDVLGTGPANQHQDALVDLIDFIGEKAVTATATVPHTGENQFNLIDRPLIPEPLPLINRSGSNSSGTSSAIRDSAISSGSSLRDSTLSSLSGGRESLLDYGFVDGTPDSTHPSLAPNRSSTLSETSMDVDRKSIISRDSVSSGTVVQESNRDSQGSVMSDEFHAESNQSGSSSAPEDDLDLRGGTKSKGKKVKKHNSIKRMIRRKAPSLGFAEHKARKAKEERRRSSPDVEVQENKDIKKKKGILRGLRAKRDRSGSGRTKESNNKVYQVIEDDVMDVIGKPPAIPPAQVQAAEEKTPKDIIDGLLEKYKEIGSQMADTSADDGLDDDDVEEEDDDVLDEADRFRDTKRKLRLVLCQADFRDLPWLMSDHNVTDYRTPFSSDTSELMTFLHVQLAEAINLQNRSLAAQLHETIRSVKQLPSNSCTTVLTSIEEDYRARMPYLAYLTRSRQALLGTHAHLERLLDRVQRNKLICKKCFISNCVTLFLEAREKEINTFINGFRSNCPTPDEKCRFVEQFLEKLYTELDQDEVWLGASDDHREEGYIAIERDIMGRIYSFAFYPNGDIDVERDKTFTEHVKQLQGIVDINHKAVRIRKMYRKEAPWPSAQQELATINAYKTPTDKLKCVQRCCFTIMNLLNMACASDQCEPAGADDFVPALVLVVIKANPPSLLSTIQYVSNFYGQRLSGEEAWSWMQFCAAVEYTKTIRI